MTDYMDIWHFEQKFITIGFFFFIHNLLKSERKIN